MKDTPSNHATLSGTQLLVRLVIGSQSRLTFHTAQCCDPRGICGPLCQIFGDLASIPKPVTAEMQTVPYFMLQMGASVSVDGLAPDQVAKAQAQVDALKVSSSGMELSFRYSAVKCAGKWHQRR